MTTYTPTGKIVHNTYADFVLRPIGEPIHLVQYDKSIPIIAVRLYYDGLTYVVPENGNVNIRVGKRDGTFVYNQALGCNADRTIVYFEVTQQMVSRYGVPRASVELEISGQIAGTSPLNIIVDQNPIQEGDIESTYEFKIGQQFATEAKASADAAAASEKAAKTSETNAKASETAAKNSEEQAKAAYQELVKADVGSLRTGLHKNHAVYDALLDSSGNNILDSNGNIIEGSTVFADGDEFTDLKKQVDSLESIVDGLIRKPTDHRLTDLEKGLSDLNDYTVDFRSDMDEFQNNMMEFKTDLHRHRSVSEALLDSEGTVMLDSNGNELLGTVIFADEAEIPLLKSSISAMESTINYFLHLLLPYRINTLLEEFHSFRDNLYNSRQIIMPLLDSNGETLIDSNGYELLGTVIFADEAEIPILMNSISALEEMFNGFVHLLLPYRIDKLSKDFNVFRSDLHTNRTVTMPLLDSDGNYITDYRGARTDGSIIFADSGDMDRLKEHVTALENSENRHTFEFGHLINNALLDSAY